MYAPGSWQDYLPMATGSLETVPDRPAVGGRTTLRSVRGARGGAPMFRSSTVRVGQGQLSNNTDQMDSVCTDLQSSKST